MTKKSRNILIAVVAAVTIIVGVVGYGFYRIYSFFEQIQAFRQVPDELKEPLITVGGTSFKKSEFFKIEKTSFAATIKKGINEPDEKKRQRMILSETAKGIYNFADIQVIDGKIIVAAEFGAYSFDLSGKLLHPITFEPGINKVKIGPWERVSYELELGNLSIVPLKQNEYGFCSFDSRKGMNVFDGNGNKLWEYGRENVELANLFDEKKRKEGYEKSHHVLKGTVGDLDGDGVSEFIVASKSDGTRVFDQNGREKWFVPDDFPSEKLAVVDLDLDGKNELVQIGKAVLDGDGKVLREMISRGEGFFLAKGKDGKSVPEYVDFSNGKLSCLDEKGNVLLATPAPLSEVKISPRRRDIPGYPELSSISNEESVAFPKAAWVKFRNDKPEYLAVVASFIDFPRANLYIFEPNGSLVYHELIDQEAETLAVVPSPNGVEDILVGGSDTIWRYSAN